MNPCLLELPTKSLLEKIGAGNHKPGSGSATALNGILTCKLLLTVIQLTLEPKRKKTYEKYYLEFTRIQHDINNRIGPRLESLFQEDSEQFDNAIRKRKQRDLETNQSKKNQLDQEALKELARSTELPIEIANLSIVLTEYSIYVFDNGFKSARGDSGVAISSALSSISGCISIISLNLQSFPKNKWTEEIKRQKSEIRSKYEKLTNESSIRLDLLDEEAELKNNFLSEIIRIRKSLLGKSKISYLEIENLARNIQNTLWKYRTLVWKNKEPESLIVAQLRC